MKNFEKLALSTINKSKCIIIIIAYCMVNPACFKCFKMIDIMNYEFRNLIKK